MFSKGFETEVHPAGLPKDRRMVVIADRKGYPRRYEVWLTDSAKDSKVLIGGCLVPTKLSPEELVIGIWSPDTRYAVTEAEKAEQSRRIKRQVELEQKAKDKQREEALRRWRDRPLVIDARQPLEKIPRGTVVQLRFVEKTPDGKRSESICKTSDMHELEGECSYWISAAANGKMGDSFISEVRVRIGDADEVSTGDMDVDVRDWLISGGTGHELLEGLIGSYQEYSRSNGALSISLNGRTGCQTDGRERQ